MTNVSRATTPTLLATPAPAIPAGTPTVIRQTTFTLRAFDHLKATQRKLKAERGLNLNNNQVLALIFEQHARHYPTTTAAATKGAPHAE